jgi:gentisate 1,2-dioxygenase
MDSATIIDRVGWENPPFSAPAAAVWRKAEIEREIERLLNTAPGAGTRSIRLAHAASGPEQGNSYGIGVSISVLGAGEASAAHRHTASVVNYVREGFGHSVIGGHRINWGPGDIFNTPGWIDHQHFAASDSPPVVRFSFSDRPLHEKLGLMMYKDAETPLLQEASNPGLAKLPPPPPIPPTGELLDDSGAQLLTYKHLLQPEKAWNDPVVWRFAEIKPHLDELDNDDPRFNGRRVVMLYHPGTGVAQGTTSTLTAFVGIIVPGEVHIPHRHTSSAINYYLKGSGYSIVGGQRLEWEAGDVALAPGWAVHGHANDGDETVWGITIHDAPLLYHMGSLLWQEALADEVTVLGRASGMAPAASL